MKSAMNVRTVSVWASVMIGMMVMLASSGVLAYTIDLGGAGAYSFGRDVSIEGGSDAADGDIMNADTIPLDTAGDHFDETFSHSGLQYYVAGTTNFYRPQSAGVTGEAVFHFQADSGFQIDSATVNSKARIFDFGGTLSLVGSWSTDNINYTPFFSLGRNQDAEAPISLTGFTPSPDLYLKYESFASSTSTQTHVRLFQSPQANTVDGFTVTGFISEMPPVPEPSTLCLIGLGLAGLAARRARRR